MKLLFDENLSRKLVPLVEDLFPGSAHISRVGIGSGASDRQVWDYAGQNGFVIVTADNDFLTLADQLGPPPKVILLDNCDYPRGSPRTSSAQKRAAFYSLMAMSALC